MEEFLKELDYHKDGYFTRKDTGKKCDYKHNKGYRYVSLFRNGKSKNYLTHRLVWFFHNGKIPEGMEIDHIDLDRSNNKIENLRLVTHAQNMKNTPLLKTNTTGIKGVYKKRNKFSVEIIADGIKHRLGVYPTIQEAEKVITEARFKLHGEYGRAV